jgi:AraC-like DNA-binding protein
MAECLRRVAESHRSKKPRRFYSIRTVAGHFGVAPTTVSRIYARLKDEGLLTSVWGSNTYVEATRLDKELRVRAIVALPVSVSSFRLLEDYRAFFLSIQDALWSCGFATHLVFHDRHRADGPDFTELLLKHKSDLVVWLYPTSRNLTITARLQDRGVRLITIGESSIFNNEYTYVTNRLTALRECLACRKHQLTKPVLVVRQRCNELAGWHRSIEAVLLQMRIPYSFVDLRSPSDEDYLFRASGTNQPTVIFPSSALIAHLFSMHASAVQDLFNNSHVILIEGPIDLTHVGFEANNVDVICVDWSQATRRIARDLAVTHHGVIKHPVSLDALWLPANRVSTFQAAT